MDAGSPRAVTQTDKLVNVISLANSDNFTITTAPNRAEAAIIRALEHAAGSIDG
jgi:hypothetical protein